MKTKPTVYPRKNIKRLYGILLMSFSLVCMAMPSHAQLEYSRTPHFGTVSLSKGFGTDPHTIRVRSGGSVDVSSLELCYDCEGYSSIAPDVRLNWTGSTQDLRIFFEADNPTEDATLIISTATGSWVGNDDANSNTLNPMVVLTGHDAGQFDIWVGSYSSGTEISGTLTITEYNRAPSSSSSSSSGSSSGSSSSNASVNISGDPHFGSVRLSKGFSSDPHTIRVVSGGSVDVSNQDLCSGCTGYVSRAPDIRLHWEGNSNDLRVLFEPDTSGEDATLLINTPSGFWVGNDDAHSNTVNPMVILGGYGSGQYDIWIGSYSADETIRGKVTITELNRRP